MPDPGGPHGLVLVSPTRMPHPVLMLITFQDDHPIGCFDDEVQSKVAFFGTIWIVGQSCAWKVDFSLVLNAALVEKSYEDLFRMPL